MSTQSFLDFVLVVTGLIILGWIFFLSSKSKSRKGKLPPGPWGFPIVGHIPLLRKDPFKTLREWKKIYGPIFYIRMGTTPTVVICNAKLLKDSFLNDSLNGRPNYSLFDQVLHRKGILFSDGKDQNELKRNVLIILKQIGFNSPSIEPLILEDLSILLDQVKQTLGKPIHAKYFFKFPTVNSLWSLILGKRFDLTDPELMKVYELLTSSFSTTTSFEKLSLYTPWFGKLFGFLGYDKSSAELKKFYNEIDKLVTQYKKSHVPNTSNSFIGVYMDKFANASTSSYSSNDSLSMLSITLADLIISGTATMTDAFDWLLLFLATNPDVQTKLQDEIDLVVGNSRIPTLNDRTNMPYAVAVGNEVLRRTAAVGLSRRATNDVEFHDYLIPKDTTIMKIPQLSDYDNEIWDKPHEFEPQRFLGENGKLKKTSLIAFGAGKKTCVGIAFSLDYMFLAVTGFFQKYTISCSDRIPSAEPNFGLTNSPASFEIIIKMR